MSVFLREFGSCHHFLCFLSCFLIVILVVFVFIICTYHFFTDYMLQCFPIADWVNSKQTMKSMNAYYNVQKKQIKEFQLVSRALLDKTEQNLLYDILKVYQQRQNVGRLVQELQILLGTPDKLQLTKILRNLIPPAHLHEFDRLNNPKQNPKLKLNTHKKKIKSSMGKFVQHYFKYDDICPAWSSKVQFKYHCGWLTRHSNITADD